MERAKDFEGFGDMILDKNLRVGLSKNYEAPGRGKVVWKRIGFR